MKKIIFIIILFALTCVCFAQGNDFLWPIQGQKAGKNILYKPQDYIGKELNFENLIIHASEGTFVQSPIDGKIVMYSYSYLKTMTFMNAYGISPTNYEKDASTFIEQGWNKSDDIKYLSVILRLELADGKVLSIAGIRPTKAFKTGEKIKKGDVIGSVGYFYKAIPQSAISVSLSKFEKPIDPMSPFGLKTTFRKAEEKQKETLSAEEAKFDLNVLVDALKEGFPGLYDYISEEEFNDHFSQALASIQNAEKISDFYKIIQIFINTIRDNHLAILSGLPIDKSANYYAPTIAFGWYNDSLMVTRTLGSESKYYKRKIKAVDGIPANVLKQKMLSCIEGIEGSVESYKDFVLKTVVSLRYFQNFPEASPKCDISLTFETGETVFFPGYIWNSKTCKNLQPMWTTFYTVNIDSLVLRKISNQTAYLGIPNFELSEVEMERIAEFISSISDSNYSHLIIDVRNNPGGSEEVTEKIFSYIAQQAFYPSTYCEVNKKGGFDFFKYCTNYTAEQDDLFPEYTSKTGESGYFLHTNNKISPNRKVNFKGKVYVLTNERSFSASTQLAAWVHKYKRGVMVGRETGSAYHQMKALKFAYLRLPNSHIVINIPLVKVVFDTCVASIPFGRGVLPDYELALSLEELSFENGDAILNYAQELIQNEDYLKEIEQSEFSATQENANWYIYVILALSCIAIIYFIIHRMKKNPKKDNYL